jgi:hypothetical protein
VKVCPFFVAHAQSIAQSLLSSHPAPKGFSPQVRQRSKHNFRQGKIGFPGTLKPVAHPKAFSA